MPCCNVGLNFLIVYPAEVSEWFVSIITKLCLNLLKLCLEYTEDSFSIHGVYANNAGYCNSNQAYFLGTLNIFDCMTWTEIS